MSETARKTTGRAAPAGGKFSKVPAEDLRAELPVVRRERRGRRGLGTSPISWNRSRARWAARRSALPKQPLPC